MILLLDSTVLIDILRNKHGAQGRLALRLEAFDELATTSINIAEIFAGIRSGEEDQTENFLSKLTCYEISRAIGRRAGLLRNAQALLGRTLGLPDLLIAATAIEHDLTLVTANRRDFPFPDLRFSEL